MTTETLHLYITDIEGYLKGDKNYCFNVSNEPPFADTPDDELTSTYCDNLYVGEFIIEVTHSIARMSDLALDRIERIKSGKRAEALKEMERLDERKAALNCLEYKPNGN